MTLALASLLLAALSQAATAPDQAARENKSSVFVTQADEAETKQSEPVYFPDPARSPAAPASAELDQLPDSSGGRAINQLSDGRPEADAVAQLSEKDGGDPLAQLTDAERQVILRAVEGTDICDRETAIPAIVELCRRKLENRSEEFATLEQNTLSPEERLLGEGLDGDRIATLERAIERLARNGADADRIENQVIASVALGATTLLPETPPQEAPPESELSLETQALINAIVEQFSGGGGN